MFRKSFASDNWAGIHPEILNAIVAANQHHEEAYGADHYTRLAEETFKQHFGGNIDVYFVFNGTAANVTAITSLCRSYQAVICTDMSHIQVDECGALENASGCKLLTVNTDNGKLTPDQILTHLERLGDQHHVQPKVISITQSTEYGTVYTPDEIAMISEFARDHDMYVHMDGARICNAAASLGIPLAAISKDVGVDVLSFGGTKNGLMFGEAVIFFNRDLSKDYRFIRKQQMQLTSKMRFIACQFSVLLSHDLWHRNASHANAMARLLATQMAEIQAVQITQPVQANAVFAIIPEDVIEKLHERFNFYIWNTRRGEVRLMCSFDTSESDVDAFSDYLKYLIG